MFNEKLKFLRDTNELTMEKFIELYNEKYNAKMNKSTLSRYEHGLQSPLLVTALQIAEFFNVSIEYMTSNVTTQNNEVYNKEEQRLIENFRSLSEQGKYYILQTMNMAINTYKKSDYSELQQEA